MVASSRIVGLDCRSRLSSSRSAAASPPVVGGVVHPVSSMSLDCLDAMVQHKARGRPSGGGVGGRRLWTTP